MKKLVLLLIAVASYVFAGFQGDSDNSGNQIKVEKYSWVADSSDDDFKAEGRRSRKGHRGRRRGGSGLR